MNSGYFIQAKLDVLTLQEPAMDNSRLENKSNQKHITVKSLFSSIHVVYSIFICLICIQIINATPLTNSKKTTPTDTNSKQQRLLVLSLGGFRHDFIQTYQMHNLGKFLHKSARAPFLNPQFTTQSFPNHWSMATGAYVETHGIVANKFYDPRFKEYFSQQGKGNRDMRWWNMSGLEPIWYTSAQQAIKTSVFNWPGCDAFFYNDSDMFTKSSYNEIGNKFYLHNLILIS
jgi:predicted AlkP superfamily pyrophosphatase or phosphodiesterase